MCFAWFFQRRANRSDRLMRALLALSYLGPRTVPVSYVPAHGEESGAVVGDLARKGEQFGSLGGRPARCIGRCRVRRKSTSGVEESLEKAARPNAAQPSLPQRSASPTGLATAGERILAIRY